MASQHTRTQLHSQDPAATIEPLGLPPREAFQRMRAMGYRAVQISAAQPGLRPRELDASARRDLVASLRRMEIICAGIDLWIPVAHFADPARIDRAVDSVIAAIELAADLGRVAISTMLPDAGPARQAILERAYMYGVMIADFAETVDADVDDAGAAGVGVDPAAILARGGDPAAFIIAHADSLITARLCDLTTSGMRAPLGEPDGRLDSDTYRAALSTCTHLHSLVVDARQWARVEEGLKRMLRLWADPIH